MCHFAGIFRPSVHLPVPECIIPHPISGGGEIGFCPGGAWEELQRSRRRETNQSLYEPTFGHDIPLAKRTIEKLQEADCNADIFVIIAHDAQVRDRVPHFPEFKSVVGTRLKERFEMGVSKGVGGLLEG